MATRSRPKSATLPKRYSVKEAAEELGLSSAIIRRHCQEETIQSEYHGIHGTSIGYYTIDETAVEWLRENVKPRQRNS